MTDTWFREIDAGPGVVCVHCNASSSAQWRGLIDRLAPRFHVLAGDGYGPAWPDERTLRLQDEVALLQPLLARAGESLALVGHSYGGAVALLAALQHPPRALVLYEPTLFALLDEEAPPPNEAEGIRQTVADAAAHLARGDRGAARSHRGGHRQRAGLGHGAVHAAHATVGLRHAGYAGAADGRQRLARFVARRGASAGQRAAAAAVAGVAGPGPHGAHYAP